MGNKEYKTAKDVMARAKEAKNVTFEEKHLMFNS